MCYKNTQGARHLGTGGASGLETPPIMAYEYGTNGISQTPTIPMLHFTYPETTQAPLSPHLAQPKANITPDRKRMLAQHWRLRGKERGIDSPRI